jgi:seryl-tRNA synthetase
MATLDEARIRLEKAVEKLDGAFTTSLQGRDGDDPAARAAARKKLESERKELKRNGEALRADHNKLSIALREAQENYAAAQVVNEAVAGRLDEALERLETMLES